MDQTSKNIKIVFALVVISWSTSWIATKHQIGIVPVELTAFYRFFGAGLILLLYSLWKNLRIDFSKKQHLLMLTQGAFVFSLNHFFFYYALHYVNSGIAAVSSSLAIIISPVLSLFLHDIKTPRKIIIGGIFGVIGLILVFISEIMSLSLSWNVIKGMLFCLFATSLFSFGNIMVQNKNYDKNNIISSTAFAMLYGSAISFLYVILTGKNITFDLSIGYVFSLIYLILFPGIVGFMGMFYLTIKIGSSQAMYTSLIYPIFALIISAIFENYHFSYVSYIGLTMIIVSNYMVLKKSKKDVVQY